MMNRISRHSSTDDMPVAVSMAVAQDHVLRWMMMAMITLIVFFSTMILSGCSGGGGGGGSTPATTTTDDTNPYSGTAKVSGTIKLSSLTSSDSAQINSQTPSSRSHRKTSKAAAQSTEGIKLYIVGDSGELEDTGISCSLSNGTNGDRAYECDGVKDGINYIVRYVKVSGTGKALELKSHAYVPPGAEAPTSNTDVTPQTSVIVKALVDAILSATAGTNIDETTVNTIIDSVKSAIKTLVESGAIQIPSMVVSVADGTTADAMIGGKTNNGNLDNTSGIILADDTIGNELGYLASGMNAAKFDLSSITTEADKAALIKKVFKDLLTNDKGGSDDMPDFFFNFFTWLYVNNSSFKAGPLLNTLITGMQYFPGAINQDQVTVANAITMFNLKINKIHELLAKSPDTLAADEKTILANTPGVIRGLFPSSFPNITTDTDLIVPRAIAFVIFFDKVFMQNTVVPTNQPLSGTADAGGQVSYSNGDYYKWSDRNLFQFLGLVTYITSHGSEFTGVDITGLYLHPGTVWLQNTSEQKDALMLNCNIEDLSSYTSQSVSHDLTGSSGATVTLTYPKKSGGTGSINLVYITGNGYSNWGLEPWSEAQMSGSQNINPDRVVSDFTSGTYTISVTYKGSTYSKSFTKTVITGMSDKYPKLITPAGMPNWPGANASQAEMDAFNKAMDAYNQNGGRTNFTANVMGDGSLPGAGQTPTKAKITVSWNAPDVTLPDGVKMVYSIDIGHSSCDGSGNCTWTPVWNSWQTHKQIYATSFTVPYLFDIQSTVDAQNNPYQININVSFVDQKTGEQLGSGGNAHSEFTVGDPINPNSTFTLRGLNSIFITDTNVTASSLRIALVKEVHNGDTYTRSIVKISDIIGGTSYALDLQISDIMSGTTANTWYNLLLINDPNKTLTNGTLLGLETTYWPDNSTGGLWFETWGGVLKVDKNITDASGNSVNEQKLITGGEIIDGPQFFIGMNDYQAPDPAKVTPVPPDVLTQQFTITGAVNTSGMTHPVVVLVSEGYDSTIGYNIQTVIGIANINGGQYTLTPHISDFYGNDGRPNGKWYQILLVEDTSPSSITIGSPLSLLPTYWPNWTNGNFGFDTWRGSQLYVTSDSYNPDTKVWTYHSWGVPGDTTSVTGPVLAMSYTP